jgi:hypothetical protein
MRDPIKNAYLRRVCLPAFGRQYECRDQGTRRDPCRAQRQAYCARVSGRSQGKAAPDHERQNEISGQRMNGKNTSESLGAWAAGGRRMWLTGTGVLKSEPLRGILSCEINGRAERWRSLAEGPNFSKRPYKTSENQLFCFVIATTSCYHQQELRGNKGADPQVTAGSLQRPSERSVRGPTRRATGTPVG